MLKLSQRKLPSYCLHKARGLAVVALDGREFYLGPYGTAVSRHVCDRIARERLANGRRLLRVTRRRHFDFVGGFGGGASSRRAVRFSR